MRRLDASAFAWCATLRRDAEPELVLGRLVEVLPGGFFEGVWDGSFSEADFLTAPTVMGSGARVLDDQVVFCAPSHAFELLYSVRTDDRLLVANSLPLLFASADDGPDPTYARYYRDLLTRRRRGTAASPLELPTARGRRVVLHVAVDLAVDRGLRMERLVKPQPHAPSDFADYRGLLAATLRRLVSNGTDPARSVPLPATTLLSNGYDSSASAVLAAEVGVSNATSILRTDKPADAGEAVARELGLRHTIFDADGWSQSDSRPDIGFAASAGGPVALGLAALEEIAPTIVITGEGGDELWERAHPAISAHLAEPDGITMGDCSMHDFRLHAGIVVVPLPTVGMVHAKEIAEISRSVELDAYSVGGSYDRPIARRIVEDAGIARGTFATTKLAGTAYAPHAALSAVSLAEFTAWWNELVAQLPARVRWARRFEERAALPAVLFAIKVLSKLRIGPLRPRRLRRVLRRWQLHRAVPNAYRFHWANEQLSKALASASKGR